MNATIQKNISERLLPVFLNVWISAADCLDCVVHVVPTSEAQEIPILMQLRFQVGAWSSVKKAALKLQPCFQKSAFRFPFPFVLRYGSSSAWVAAGKPGHPSTRRGSRQSARLKNEAALQGLRPADDGSFGELLPAGEKSQPTDLRNPPGLSRTKIAAAWGRWFASASDVCCRLREFLLDCRRPLRIPSRRTDAFFADFAALPGSRPDAPGKDTWDELLRPGTIPAATEAQGGFLPMTLPRATAAKAASEEHAALVTLRSCAGTGRRSHGLRSGTGSPLGGKRHRAQDARFFNLDLSLPLSLSLSISLSLVLYLSRLYLYLPVYLSIYQSIDLPIYPYVYLSDYLDLSIHLCMYVLCMCECVYVH